MTDITWSPPSPRASRDCRFVLRPHSWTPRRGTGLRFEDDGVAPMTSAHVRIKPEEIIAAGPITPPPGRGNGTPVKGRWGGVNISTSRSRGRMRSTSRKIIAPPPQPPLVPFHHDPAHNDETLDQLLSNAVLKFRPACRVTAGREGTSFEVASKNSG
jgi:hypothetical protein